jgi:tetratricopeptide (TPR) repeat protein
MRLVFAPIAMALAVIACGPASAASKKDLADCEKADGDRRIAACTRIINGHGESTEDRVSAYVNRGVTLADNGDPDRALVDFGEAIELDPNNDVAYFLRGSVLSIKGDFDRAIVDFNQAVRLNPTNASNYGHRGAAWHRKGDPDQAIEDFDEAIRLDPKFTDIYLKRAAAWRDKKDLVHAIADFSQAIKLDPTNIAAYADRAGAWLVQEDYEHAVADYDEIIRLDPKRWGAYASRGIALQKEGEFDRAVADFSEAIRLQPKSVIAHAGRGRANFGKGDLSAAADDLAHANELADDTYAPRPYLMLWRFLALARLGQDGAAELAGNAERLKSKDWPYPVFEFYLGRRSQDALNNAAENSDQRCEAQFYLGEWQLWHGRRDDAAKALHIAADTCPKGFLEYDGAVAELRRLKQ